MLSIHGLAIHSLESNKKQPVEFDGFGTHGYCTCSIRWAILWSTESIKSSRWSLMDLIHMWLHALFAGLYCGVLNPTKAAGGVWWIWYTHGYMLYSLGYTVEYWIQQKQPVEFDGFDTHVATCSIRWAILWSTESIKSSRWSLMDLIHTWLHALFAGLYCGVLNPSKAAGGVWWIWYTWLHALFAGLYCGVLNPTKAAGGVWWIWYTCGYMLYSLGYTVEYWIQQKQPVEFDGFDTHVATCSIRWAILWSTESNKSSRWSLMDLIHMWLHALFAGLYCGVLNPTKAAGGVWWIWYTCGYMLYSLGYTVEYWIQQKQPVEFDGFETHVATCSIRWAILWSTESIKSSRWSLMDLIHMWLHALFAGLTVEYWIHQKQPVEFDGFDTHVATCSIRWAILWSTESNKSSRWSLMDLIHMWLHALFAGLYCGVLNPTKAAGGVWWIWYTCGYMLYSLGYTVEYWIQQKQPVEFDGFDTHVATCSIRWAILWSTESIKSSRWSLMDLIHMWLHALFAGLTVEYWIHQKQPVEFDGFDTHVATCSIRWAILWSTESIKSSRWSLIL